MADICKIQVQGIAYDIEDAVSRESIGDISTLETEQKDNLVIAINSLRVKAEVDDNGVLAVTHMKAKKEVRA